MSSEELLDTWFLQLDKKDSPVTHKVVYQVTDSIGNITEESCSVKIKYNEFPVIEAQDRYFTLQEAQQGAITEEVLKTQAISEGKVKANDTEEGDLSEKLKLLDFHPEEFQKIYGFRVYRVELACSGQHGSGWQRKRNGSAVYCVCCQRWRNFKSTA